MPTTCERAAVGEGGVLCKRCGNLLDANAVLVIIHDVIERFCCAAHAAEDLTARRAHSPSS